MSQQYGQPYPPGGGGYDYSQVSGDDPSHAARRAPRVHASPSRSPAHVRVPRGPVSVRRQHVPPSAGQCARTRSLDGTPFLQIGWLSVAPFPF